MPLPNSYPGFRWGSVGAPVMIEGFLDLLCPDCSGAWPTVLSVLNHYGPSKVSFTFHVFPLPYHTFAFLAAQGAQVIKSVNGSDAAVFDYISLIFANQDSFYSTTQSISQITDAYATLVAANLPYTKAAFLAGVRQGATPFPPPARPFLTAPFALAAPDGRRQPQRARAHPLEVRNVALHHRDASLSRQRPSRRRSNP